MLGLEGKYAYAVGRSRAVEAKLLDRATIDRVVDAPDVQSAFKILGEAGYSYVDSILKEESPIDEVLNKEEMKLFYFIKETSPDERLIDIFTLPYDYHNIKVLLKARTYGVPPAGAISGLASLSTESINDALGGEVQAIPDEFSLAIERAQAVHSLRPSPEIIDIIVDKEMYGDLLKRARAIGIPFLTKQIQNEIDCLNLSIFFRARKMGRDAWLVEHALVPGGKLDSVRLATAYKDGAPDSLMNVLSKTGYEFIAKRGLELLEKGRSLSEIERFFEGISIRLIDQARQVPLGPEPFIGYILAKQRELEVVRLVIASKTAGVSRDSMRERLRDGYV